ncbi:hypothetical protein PPYR_13347 [Photinus pyralis]|uniref:Uncharacterized protein n=1 Tax=Photinus pyralis TaxID=7054 RepID=A0A1Y1ME64_PHOPY|nr:hypothetical protein PPYR_13347 [Photinus pyralis]
MMTQNRKRGRNLNEDEVEFMPLSKRINNLHINGNIFFESHNAILPHSNLAVSDWGQGPPCYNGEVSYSSIQTPTESLQNVNFDTSEYNPVLSAAENPHYFYKNKLLFEMHIERMQRNSH